MLRAFILTTIILSTFACTRTIGLKDILQSVNDGIRLTCEAHRTAEPFLAPALGLDAGTRDASAE